MRRNPFLAAPLISAALLVCRTLPSQAQTIGNHRAVFDSHGTLKPWTSWKDAIAREMSWYARCPEENGYPRFVVVTFMDGDYNGMKKRPDTIPAMQNGMGILSYLKYYAFTGKKDRRWLDTARAMGDFLTKEALTPNSGKYPLFPRSTGRVGTLPLPENCGSQADGPYEIQPDKGGIAGYALLRLYDECRGKRYLEEALHIARVLTANMVEGDSTHSPWPFRADFRAGEARGPISSNMAYILRLFDGLAADGYGEFAAPREKLWRWIKDVQIPNADAEKPGNLWAQFFEDYALPNNRNSWAPMNTARYLLEKREALDPDWQKDSRILVEFVTGSFTSVRSGVPVCGEQDDDKEPWGGALSTYGAVLAMYAAATKSPEYKALAYQALNYGLYATNDDGCPGQTALYPKRGGWQEDSHTDKIHNYVDAMTAFPEWAR